MDAPLVLGIAGSPRRNGNSEQLLDACLAGAADGGARVQKLVVTDYAIEPCRGCNSCSLTGECVIHDRMHEVYAAIDSAQAIVVASPVFFATVPGVLKVLIDRMQPYWARTHVLKQPRPVRRPGALLLVRSGGDPYGFVAAEYTIKSVFAVLGIDLVGEMKVTGLDSASDVIRQPDDLVHARELGVQVATAALLTLGD
ncbi:MAG: NADPH-dependent FMN [Actinobacteria bacterium]|nr:MAG: NADPH-dependent FMN [Actinomycetota bacterium]